MIRKPDFKLLYKGVDITADVVEHVLEVTYCDKLDGEADEIEVTLQDKDGLWRGPWCPETGDECELWIGYAGEQLIYCGKFEMDEPEADLGDGDTFTMSGQSVPVSKSLRTSKTKGYDNKSLKQIAQQVASDHGLTIVGTPPDVDFERQTQRRERPLEFLSRLATSYGAYFSVKGDKLIFAERKEVHDREASITLRANSEDYLRGSLKRSSDDTYSEGKMKHFDGQKKKTHAGESKDARVKNGNVLMLDERVENEGQAKKRIASELEKKNLKAQTASFNLIGTPLACAGQMVQLTDGFGKWDGKYVISQSRHKISKAGYTTDIELKSPEAAKKDAASKAKA